MRKLVFCLITALSLAAVPAYADRGYGGGHGGNGRSHYGAGSHRGGGSGGGGSIWPGVAIIGAIAGLAILAERSQPVYVDPYPRQPVYLEPPVSVAPAHSVYQPWYYCESSAMYHPYAQACPEGWQVVPARPY